MGGPTAQGSVAAVLESETMPGSTRFANLSVGMDRDMIGSDRIRSDDRLQDPARKLLVLTRAFTN